MASVESLCTTVAVLDGGQLLMLAEPAAAIAEYTKSVLTASSERVDLSHHSGRKPGAVAVMKEIALSSGGANTSVFRMGEPISFALRFEAPKPIRPCFGLTIKTERGSRVFHISDRFCNELASCDPQRSGAVVCEIACLQLMPGRYVVDLWFEDFAMQASLDMIADAASFQVVAADLLGTGRLPPVTEGPLFQRAHWKLLRCSDDRLPSYAVENTRQV